MTLLQDLKNWQVAQAQREGVESYRVLPYTALAAIAQALPRNTEALLAIKGVGPVKVRKYAKDILTIVAGDDALQDDDTKKQTTLSERADVFEESDVVNSIIGGTSSRARVAQAVPTETVVGGGKRAIGAINRDTGEIRSTSVLEALSVQEFLAHVNQILGSYFPHVRVRGEIIGFKRNQNGHTYFELKDKEAIVRCSIFRNAYNRSGVVLADGMEVIITGKPSHHVRYGFSFIGDVVEPVGEGALKKAYDALKKKLEIEGLMSLERKRVVPALPRRIGLITSPTGAAIGDFVMNVGKYGYHIRFCASSVEGAQSVKEILIALNKLATMDLELLVITRGGGSLESLAAFNNEYVVRALANFPVPVIAGIGHEQDETLATLVADVGVSTPTAAARAVRASWDDALAQLTRYEQNIVGWCRTSLQGAHDTCDDSMRVLERFFAMITERAVGAKYAFEKNIAVMDAYVIRTKERCYFYEKTFTQYNPLRQLKLGYSIAKNKKGQIVRSIKDVQKSDILEVQVEDGKIDVEVRS